MSDNRMTIKPSDINTEFSTGAVRGDSTGRGQFSLMPFDALLELAKLFEAGALKYAARNWEKGIPLSKFLDSEFRHTERLLAGDTSEPHAVQRAWNSLCFLATYLRIGRGQLPAELNDLPLVPVPGHEISMTTTSDLD